MNKKIVVVAIILLVSSSMYAVRTGQKRSVVPTTSPVPAAVPFVDQQAKELEKKLTEAQQKVAAGAIVTSSPTKIARTMRFIENAKALAKCYRPSFLGGIQCEAQKKEKLKARLRAQLPTIDRDLLIKLGIGAAALATVGLIVWRMQPEFDKEGRYLLTRYKAGELGNNWREKLEKYANKLSKAKRRRFYEDALAIALEKPFAAKAAEGDWLAQKLSEFGIQVRGPKLEIND